MKSMVPKLVLVSLVAAFLVSSSASAQIGALVSNWSGATGNLSSGGAGHTGFHAMGDISAGIGFVAVTPCRIVDTRGPAGTFGAPSLVAGVPRNFPLPTGPCTGIPTGVGAYSLNITVTNTAGPGFILIYPQGGSQPLVSTVNYVAGQTIANAAIVPAGTAGGITVVAGVSATDLIIDINGYLSQLFNPGNFFSVVSPYSGGGGVIFGSNTDTTAAGDGGHFRAASPVNGSAGVVASADAGSGQTYGVQGITNSTTGAAFGVYGLVPSASPGGFSAGVRGQNNGTGGSGIGVWGSQVGSGWGGYFTSVTGIGVLAQATGAGGTGVEGDAVGTGVTEGVLGTISSTTSCATGVEGDTSATVPCLFGGTFGVFGNDGTTGGIGILGLSQNRGIQGARTNASGVLQTSGVLGYAGTSGVHSFEDVTAGGAKPFVMPFAGRPEKQIVFVSTEADEVLTATRGRIVFQRGLAVIKLSEAFMMASEAEGWSVQLTPIGQMASIAVVKMDAVKGEIVVQASRDVSAFYRVEGVRKGYKDFQAIQDNVYFVPESAVSKMPPWPATTQKILVDNKIYNEDGTANLDTAKAMGWTKIWEQKEAESKALMEKSKRPTQDGN